MRGGAARWLGAGLLALFAGVHAWGQAQAAQADSSTAVASSIGDAGDAIERPFTAEPGDAIRGRSIVTNRQVGLCLLCHSGPFPEERFQGNIAPSLAGAGTRWSEAQLRLRVADSRRINPASIMPSYLQAGGGHRVGSAWQGKPILQAQQIEDVVAFLRTLRQ